MLRLRKTANPAAGTTLLELIIAIGILVILAGAALPLVRATIRREREAELHRDLREMRNAIDRSKDAADKENATRTPLPLFERSFECIVQPSRHLFSTWYHSSLDKSTLPALP
jgi:type II secretory pathway pseudopilin PulG